ncbi:flagellar filament capping protein FliD [Aliikangiella sp. G2MR2-5]|uniref:flagellar filament capping protein FliD n=1 Tax=Aliikangiella sp. G2MR2-5 TaxID=2788943 RepID=UPI0018ABF63C|nr:flagellar filament capping protein FliD [Aliikangiella sp. G2MR2-5]
MGLITSAGIGSGIDVESIISALVNAERAPKEASLNRLESVTESTLSGLGTLKSALSSLQDAIENLTSDAFQARLATSSDETQLTATASSSASQGSFDVTIVQTADYTQLSSSTIAGDSSTVLGSGNLTLQNSNGDSFIVAVGATDSLADIVNNINSASDNFGISATLVNGDSGTKIVYRGEDTGAIYDFTVTNDNANLAPISDGNGGTLTIDQTAQDATIQIAGLDITSTTNTFTDPVLGVDITLDADAVAGTVTVDVERDVDTVKSNIEAFVDAYNEFVTTTNTLGSAEEGAEGELLGDSTLRNVVRQIRTVITDAVVSATGNYNTLASIDITSLDDGTLSLGSDLDGLLATNFDDVGYLFSATDGIGAQIDAVASPYTDFDGLIKSREDSLNSIIDRVEDDRVNLDYRMEQLQMQLRTKFGAMDAAVAQFNFTGQYLQQQFASIALQTANNS